MKIDLSRFSGRFRQETRDNLTQIDSVISRIENDRQNDTNELAVSIRELMRLIHAIKGGARMLGFGAINQLCHTTEEMLIGFKDRSEIANYEIDLIAESRKGIERLLALTHEPDESQIQNPVWLDRLLKQLLAGDETDIEPGTERKQASINPRESAPHRNQDGRNDSWRDSTVRVDVDSIDDLLYYGRELTQALDGLRKGQAQIDLLRSQIESTLNQRRKSENSGLGLTLGESDQFLRSLAKLSFNLRDKIAEVDRNVRQIDSGAVELRMRPITELFETIPLQVRDLCRTLGKDVDIEFSGETVRLDGRIVELLREPLLHIIRNALDHGIESSETRISNSKSPRGRITLGAHENAGWARVVIADDGGGIDNPAVWERAKTLGIIDPGEVRPKDQKLVYNILFDDRFSSRALATDVSGRGVGLAAVKRRLQELRGTVSIESIPGMGTRFTLLMPTSLSSQHVLVTSTRFKDELRFFAFPTAMIKGTSRWDHSSEEIFESTNLEIESETIKAFSLGALLEGKRTKPGAKENYLILCSDGNISAAFSVEQIIAETEIVIEPLPHIARSADIIAGAAPLTSDEIALVINIPTILASAFSSPNKEHLVVDQQ